MEELEIRKSLISHLTKLRTSKKQRIVEELGVCQGDGRIDVAVINGKLIGYEIKSQKDTLKRLESQILTYQKIFEKITLVTVEDHLEEAQTLIPETWGIIVAKRSRGKTKLKNLRSAARNNHIDRNSIIRLLWKEETIEVLNRYGITSGLSKLDRDSLWSKVLEVIPQSQLITEVSAAIIKRQYWRSV